MTCWPDHLPSGNQNRFQGDPARPKRLFASLNTGRPSVHTPRETNGRTNPFRYLFADCWRTRASGVEPVFLEKHQAINYAGHGACFRSGETRILDSTGNLELTIPFSEADRKL